MLIILEQKFNFSILETNNFISEFYSMLKEIISTKL